MLTVPRHHRVISRVCFYTGVLITLYILQVATPKAEFQYESYVPIYLPPQALLHPVEPGAEAGGIAPLPPSKTD